MTGHRTPPDRAREVVWQLRRVCPEEIAADLTGYAGFDRQRGGRAHPYPGPAAARKRGLAGQTRAWWSRPRAGSHGSRVAVLDGTGHYPMIENPVEFNAAVREFVKETW